jgi:spermidine/putrescine transport system permease protein
VLLSARVIPAPLEWLYTPSAVIIGLVYAYLPFMILPVYGSAEKLDQALVEAAHDLGAGPLRTFREVIIPLTWPGIAAGSLLVFVPAIGMFAITDLLGGAKVSMVGNVIQNQFTKALNFPFGAALGVVFTGLFMLSYFLLQGRNPKPVRT